METTTIKIKDSVIGKVYATEFDRITEREPETAADQAKFISVLHNLLDEPESVIDFIDKIQLFQVFLSRCHSHQVSLAIF